MPVSNQVLPPPAVHRACAAPYKGPAIFVHMARVFVICVVAALAYIVVWYSDSMYLDRDVAVLRDFECATRQLSLHPMQPDHWLDKYALLGAKRGALLTWDEDIDVSIMTQDLHAARRVLEDVAADCKLTLSEGKDPGQHDWVLAGPRPGVPLHVRWCQAGEDGSIFCPGAHGMPADDLARADVLPTHPCAVHGVVFSCPHEPNALLRREFGPDWSTRVLLSLRERSA